MARGALTTEKALHKQATLIFGGSVTRFENTVRTGVFDANFVARGHEHWLEYKIRDGNLIKVRGTQFIWATERLAHGAANLWFLVGHPIDPVWLYPASLIVQKCNPSYNDGKGHMLIDVRKVSGECGWTGIYTRLFSG